MTRKFLFAVTVMAAAVMGGAGVGHAVIIEDSLFTESLRLSGHTLDGIVIRNCRFEGISGTGIDLSDIRNGRIQNCNFVNISGSGIWLQLECDGWAIRDCQFNNIGRNGVLADEQATNLLIEGCGFVDVATDSTGQRRHGVYVQGYGFTIQDNSFERIHDGNGISIRTTGVVRRNLVGLTGLLGQRSEGIDYFPNRPAGPSQTLTIENNIVWDPSGGGIELDASVPDSLNYAANFVIRFNTVVIRNGPFVAANNPLGIHIDHDLDGEFVSVYGNLVVNEVIGFNDDSEAPDHADVAVCNKVFAGDAGFFADWAGNDFHLRNNALVVDVVVNSPAIPAADVDGQFRPMGSAADVGADELAPVTQLLVATEDTYVRGGENADNNFNGDGFLRVKNAPGAGDDGQAFLKFDLTSVSDQVISAVLYLFLEALPNGTPAATQVYSVESDEWSESTLTWNTRPPATNLLDGRTDLNIPGRYYSFDVTPFATSEAAGDGILSLKLTSDDQVDLAADFDQREDALPARLIVSTFPVQQVQLNINIDGQGQVLPSPSGQFFDPGTLVSLSAVPAPDWTFLDWNGAVSGASNPVSFVVMSDTVLSARFELLDPHNFVPLPLEAPPIASAEADSTPAIHAADGLIETRWEASADAWLQLDIGEADTVSVVSIAWYLGDERLYDFDVESSTDSTTWTPLLNGRKNSGNSSALEMYVVPQTVARFVRIVGHGNDVDTSVAISEARLLVTLDAATAVEEANLPRATQLFPGAPNPANPSTTIRYDLAAAAAVRLGIYDVSGRLISTLVNSRQPAGRHAVVWNGRDHTGHRVSSGMYYARLQTPDRVQSIKLTVLQ